VDQGLGEGTAQLIEIDGERAVVEATRPFPVGATLTAIDETTGIEYRVKVRRGRLVREGWFRLEGRFVTLTKAEREALLEQMAQK